ncbi:MAG: Agmatine deiminase [Candidatus Omnitrophica bacterium ADurb.Bin292]|nr:MAG: Agmatine deiminase [Candidatus Omnitrophica bacterium ADurb.Bin292]
MISEIETNYVCFTGLLLKRYPQLFESLDAALEQRGIPYGLISGTRDIWCRDYMPIQVAEDSFVQFKYDPKYLRYKKYRHTITNVDAVCEAIGIKPIKSKIRLDGGNVVTSGSRVIMTDRAFSENPRYSRKRLLGELKELLRVERIIIIPQCPGDMTGHADGLVRFADEAGSDKDTVYVSDLSSACLKYFPKLYSALTQAGLTPILIPYSSPKKYDRVDATGTYINYLRVGKFVFYPMFGSKADASAEKIFSKLFGSGAVPVRVGRLAKEGGVLNCISWNLFRKGRKNEP